MVLIIDDDIVFAREGREGMFGNYIDSQDTPNNHANGPTDRRAAARGSGVCSEHRNVNQMKSSQQRISGTTLFTRLLSHGQDGYAVFKVPSFSDGTVYSLQGRNHASGMCGIGWSFRRTSRSVCAFALVVNLLMAGTRSWRCLVSQ